MKKHQILTNISSENIYDIDNQIKETIGDLTQNGINSQNIPSLVEKHLESIKTLLMQPEHLKSYPNIRLLFENKEGFNALKTVLQFECNQSLGIITQNDVNVLDSMQVLKDLFVKSNSGATEIQKSISEIEQFIKSTKERSKGLKKELKESAKTVLPKLFRVLFTKMLKIILHKTEKEQSQKSGKELNNLKDQLHNEINPFNKELNSLMDIYSKSIEEYKDGNEHIYATIGNPIYDVPKSPIAVVSDTESNYLSMDGNKRKNKPYDEVLKEVNDQEPSYVDPDYINIGVQTKEVIMDFKKIDAQKKVTPPVSPPIDAVERVRNQINHSEQHQHSNGVQSLKSKFEQQNNSDSTKPQASKVSDIRSKFEPSFQQRGSVSSLAKTFAEPQKVSRNVERSVKTQNIKAEVNSLRQSSTSTKQLSTNQQIRPQTLKIPTAFNGAFNTQSNQKQNTVQEGKTDFAMAKEHLEKNLQMSSPATSPKQSPTSTKKTFGTVVENGHAQNEAPKEVKQFVASNANGTSIPPPPPIGDLIKFKPKLASSPVDNNKGKNYEAKRTKKSQNSSPTRNNMMAELKQKLEKNKTQTTLDSPSIEIGSENTRGK